MTIPFSTIRKRWLEDADFRREYDAIGPEMAIAFAIAAARARAGLTQAELAARIGTKQSVVSRWESAQSWPSTKSMLRIAEATGSRLRVDLVPA
jgi:HTH-type transcriptional regulator/antitoxin HipB